MNRAQRRAIERAQGRNGPTSAMPLYASLVRQSHEPVPQKAKHEVTLEYLQAINSQSPQARLRLNEYTATGFHLARLIWKEGTPATKALIEPSEAVFVAASAALYDYGMRYRENGVSVMTDKEKAAVMECYEWLKNLLDVASTGQFIRALEAAGSDVEKALKQ